jgi:hypothetical protein
MVSFSSAGSDGNADERRAAQRRMALRMSPPDNELPGVLPLSSVIGQSADLVVAVVAGLVYSTGVELRVIVRLRRGDAGDNGRLFDEVHGHGRHGSGTPALLIGVGYPDGRSATNLPGRRALFEPGADDDSPVLVPGSGGGDDRGVDVSLWLWPLPPPGDLTVVCAWPARGIAETRTVIATDALARAARGTTELWPWEPPPEHAEAEPPAPTDLPDGWFKAVAGSSE